MENYVEMAEFLLFTCYVTRVLLLLCKQTELSTIPNVLNNLISIGRSFKRAEMQNRLVTPTKRNTGNTVIFNKEFDKSFD